MCRSHCISIGQYSPGIEVSRHWELSLLPGRWGWQELGLPTLAVSYHGLHEPRRQGGGLSQTSDCASPRVYWCPPWGVCSLACSVSRAIENGVGAAPGAHTPYCVPQCPAPSTFPWASCIPYLAELCFTFSNKAFLTPRPVEFALAH